LAADKGVQRTRFERADSYVTCDGNFRIRLMTTPGSELAAEIAAACQAAATEIAAAFGRAFDGEFAVNVGQPATRSGERVPEELASAGLAICLQVNERAVAIVLPEACGLIPAWYAQPDATGRSKLTTLAQELGMLVLPETATVSQFAAARSLDLARWLARGELPADCTFLPLDLSDSVGRQGTAQLFWPMPNPAALLLPEVAEPVEAGAATRSQAPPSARRIPAAEATVSRVSEEALPSYSRSLLRIQVPVMVTLAEKRQAVSRIVELGPGSIIQFDKPCEELLELEVAGHKIGKGEAVKVGDKFGLRLTSLIIPDERFLPVSSATP
jgi:flagellar motor switch/type III secretory pathway protein FliN